MATPNSNNANLFGEDTDSDESVGATPVAAPPAASKEDTTATPATARKSIGDDEIGDDESSDDDDDEPSKKKEQLAAKENETDNKPKVDAGGEDEQPKADKDDNDGDDTATKEKKDGDEEAPPSSSSTPTKSKNAALFGDDDDSSEDEGVFDGDDDGIVGKKSQGGSNKGKRSGGTSGMSMNQRLGLAEDDEDADKADDADREEEDKPKYYPPRRMELQDLGITKGGSKVNPKMEYYMTKLPNLVGIQPEAYDRSTHDPVAEEEQYRGYVHNMIRWRYKTDEKGEYVRDANGEPLRESNTRFVKWSDGSLTLHVGKEVLEVDNLDSSHPKDHPDPNMRGFAGINGYLYVSQKAKIYPPTKKELAGPPEGKEAYSESELVQEEGRPPAKPAGTVLECIGPISSRLALRPSSLASEAHRNLKLQVQKKTVKRARIAEIVTEVDPEMEKQKRIKGKDDLHKSQTRKVGGRRSGGGGGRRRGMNAGYLEDDEDYDGVNLGSLKKKTMRRDENSDDEDEMDYGEDSDEEEEEEWMTNKKRKRGAAAARASAKDEKDESSEEGEVVFGDDSDDEDEEMHVKKRATPAKKSAAVFDSDDDD